MIETQLSNIEIKIAGAYDVHQKYNFINKKSYSQVFHKEGILKILDILNVCML